MGRSRAPEGQIGVFKQYAEVPQKYRLEKFTKEFENRDAWSEFVSAGDRREYMRTSDDSAIQRVEREWKQHMEPHRGHHALATPGDVNEWVRSSLKKRALATTQHPYWAYIEGFHSWMQKRTDYPHLYHPVRMAAVGYSEAREVWEYRCSHRERHK